MCVVMVCISGDKAAADGLFGEYEWLPLLQLHQVVPNSEQAPHLPGWQGQLTSSEDWVLRHPSVVNTSVLQQTDHTHE